jgi:hypothetical protein
MQNECYSCIHRREIPGDAHTKCVKPDSNMIANQHGLKHGWFFYPFNFDPIWKMKFCSNFEEKK